MKLLNSIKWIAYAEVFKILVQVANILVLTQFIPPNEYGLMAIALVVVNFGLLLKDQGIAKALIQKKDLTNELIDAAFWFGLYLSLFIMLLTMSFSSKIADFYENEKLVPVLLIISLLFPLNSLTSVHTAILERESKFKLLSSVESVSILISFVVALTLAVLGWGVYSLVFQSLTYSLIATTLLLHYTNHSIKLSSALALKPVRDLFHFSFYLFVFNLVNYSSRNADNILVGKYMSVTALGSYSLAYRIMQFPLASVSFVVSRALLPVLSRQQDNIPKIRETYLECVYTVLLIVAPFMFFVNIFSSELILLFIGKEWVLSGNILSILSLCAIIQCVLSLSGPVFMSKGLTSRLMKLGMIGATLHTTGFLIGVGFDIITFTKIYLITNIINAIVVLLSISKLLKINSFSYISPCAKLLSINFLCWVSVISLRVVLPNLFSGPSILDIISTAILYFLAYLIILYAVENKFRNLIEKNVLKRFK